MGLEAFKTIIMIIGGFASIAVIGLVLMQHGKGADAGAAFGSGSAQGVFGSSGNANFLSRSTAIAAAIFFACCLALNYISKQTAQNRLNFDDVPAAVSASSPQVPAASAVTSTPQSPAASAVIPE